MNPASLIRLIETTAPLHLAAGWDKSGVQIAGTRQEIHRLAIMLDPIPTTIDSALSWGADFLLCHHPLSLSPRLPDRLDHYHRVLTLTLSKGAWLYAAHTSLDANPKGPVAWAFDALGLTNKVVLEPSEQEQAVGNESGFGLVGRWPTPTTGPLFLSRLREVIGINPLAVVGVLPKLVSSVAVCPGSGASLIPLATAAGADIFITGDVKYHQALTALEHNLCVVDVGHFVLEEGMMSRWTESLRRELDRSLELKFFPGTDPIKRTDLE